MGYHLFLEKAYKDKPNDPILTHFRSIGFTTDTSGAGDYAKGNIIVTFRESEKGKITIQGTSLPELSDLVKALHPNRILTSLGHDVSDQFGPDGTYIPTKS